MNQQKILTPSCVRAFKKTLCQGQYNLLDEEFSLYKIRANITLSTYNSCLFSNFYSDKLGMSIGSKQPSPVQMWMWKIVYSFRLTLQSQNLSLWEGTTICLSALFIQIFSERNSQKTFVCEACGCRVESAKITTSEK